MKSYIKNIIERVVAISALIFPFIEVSYYFGAKVFLSTDSIMLKRFYVQNIAKLAAFYEGNIYVIFGAMVFIFIMCSRGTVNLTKFARFNIIQAILLNVVCSCVGSIYVYLPIVVRESILGVLLANFLYLGTVIVMGYCAFLVLCGKYPKIPVLTDAAKLQVQRGYSD